jgi:hypothetical protein
MISITKKQYLHNKFKECDVNCKKQVQMQQNQIMKDYH